MGYDQANWVSRLERQKPIGALCVVAEEILDICREVLKEGELSPVAPFLQELQELTHLRFVLL